MIPQVFQNSPSVGVLIKTTRIFPWGVPILPLRFDKHPVDDIVDVAFFKRSKFYLLPDDFHCVVLTSTL